MRELANGDESLLDSPRDRRLVNSGKTYESSGGETSVLPVAVEAAHISRNPVHDQVRKLGIDRKNDYSQFKTCCLDILLELADAEQFLESEILNEDGLSIAIEVENQLNKLYEIRWGEAEALKKIVTLLQSQVLNVNWTLSHVQFLRDTVAHVGRQYVLDDSVVGYCYERIDSYGLDRFRGTMSESAVRKKFRIIEVDD